jgi:hypothetical protein
MQVTSSHYLWSDGMMRTNYHTGRRHPVSPTLRFAFEQMESGLPLGQRLSGFFGGPSSPDSPPEMVAAFEWS